MIEYKSLNELVYEEIKNRIVSNQYQPGQKLDVDQIAAELGVSRTPVTNSLKVLEKDGYVTIIQRSGTYVRKYSKEEIDTLFDFRAALEEVVVGRAIEHADQKILGRYRSTFYASLNDLNSESLPDKMQYLDATQQKFHSYLWKLCPKIIYNEIHNVMMLTRQITVRHINYYVTQSNALEFARNEILVHIALAEAIMERNEEKARECIRADVIGTKKDILAHFEEIEAVEADFT